MAATLVPLNQASLSCAANGGYTSIWIAEKKYISAITVASGVITNFTMTTTGKWNKWEPDLDNTANYAQNGNRTGKNRNYTQIGFAKFGGIDATMVLNTQNAVQVCDVVAVYVLPNGTRLVQGIEIDAAATGGFTSSKIEQTLLIANVLTDTAQNENRTEFTIQGIAALPSSTTTVTDSAFAAL